MKRLMKFGFILSVMTMTALFASSRAAWAQSPGNNAVYNSSSCCAASTAYIDASAVTLSGSTNTDLCTKIYAALSLIGSGTTSVIDARGVTNLACPSGNTPWVFSGTAVTPSATILLPAGTITTNTAWTIPNGTRVIGEGSGEVGSSPAAVTAIKSTAATIINMGSSSSTYCPLVSGSYVCKGVSIEDVGLNGAGTGGSGVAINNNNAQEQSYVRRVAFYQIPGIGLRVLAGGANSGPYSELSFGATAAGTGTSCVAINSVSTRGVHGLNCMNSGSVPSSGAGILLGGSNNSLEDVVVQGFHDGVQIGSNAGAQGDVVVNISAGTTTPSVANAIIHITTTHTVSDLTIMGVNKGGATYSIEDDITAGAPKLSDASVGMYAIGESIASGTYSRFTTSPTLPAWIQSNSAAGSSSCVIGSLYSNSSGTNANNDLYVCTPSGSHSCSTTPCWTPVK